MDDSVDIFAFAAVFVSIWWILCTVTCIMLCITSNTPLSEAFFMSFVYGCIALVFCLPVIIGKILGLLQSLTSKVKTE